MLFISILLLSLSSYFVQVLSNDNISIQDAPYTVTIETNAQQFLGTGAILGKNWALAPAKAVTPYAKTLNKLRVRSGSGKFLKRGGLHRVKKLYFSPVEDSNGAVALIEIVNPFKFSLTVYSVSLANEVVNQGETLFRIGWMYGAEKGSQLSKTDVQAVDFEDCAEEYEYAGVIIPISMSCTNNSSDKWQTGDLLVYQTDLQGLFVNMSNDKVQDLPVTFIDVTYHGSWIRGTIDGKGV